MPSLTTRAAGGVSQLRLSRVKQSEGESQHSASSVFPVMKGHEDGGMFFGTSDALPDVIRRSVRRSTLKSLERR